jgi:CRP-like cAMP-binding protein
VKKLFERLVGSAPHNAPKPPAEADDEGFFATVFMERPAEASPITDDAAARARQRLMQAAQPLEPGQGLALLERAWGRDRWMALLDSAQRDRLAAALEFIAVPGGQEVIAQDEPGDFALVVLDGLLAIDRIQPWGARARLTEAREGDVLGELSLLDAGTRFSSCMTLGRCVLAFIDMQRLQELARRDPQLAFVLLACIARRLSLRLRQVSARLGALLASA